MLRIPGAARKTSNVVLGSWYRIASGVVVDTHVLRLSRRLELTLNDDPVKVEARPDADHPAGPLDRLRPPDDPSRPPDLRSTQAKVRGLLAGDAVQLRRQDVEFPLSLVLKASASPAGMAGRKQTGIYVECRIKRSAGARVGADADSRDAPAMGPAAFPISPTSPRQVQTSRSGSCTRRASASERPFAVPARVSQRSKAEATRCLRCGLIRPIPSR